MSALPLSSWIFIVWIVPIATAAACASPDPPRTRGVEQRLAIDGEEGGCEPNPCQHDGRCTDDRAGGYTCECLPGYGGTSCEINLDDCTPDPCLHGGTCIDGIDAFTCECTADWTGALCEISVCDDHNVCTADELTESGCVYTPSPGEPACLTQANSIASGANHSCAIREGGKVYCWGRRDEGQLGDGSTAPGSALTPVQVSGLTDAVAIDAGYDHTCAVRATDEVVCWGSNAAGQLGTGNTAASAVPVALAGIADARVVAAGRAHTCVLRMSGELWCVGRGIEGQLGQGASATSLAPVKVIDNADLALVGGTVTAQPHPAMPWVAVSASDTFTCGLRADGQVLCWGRNGNGQLGLGVLGDRNQPALVAGVTDAIAIAAGTTHACAVRAGGHVACWGASGALGRTGADLLVPDLIGDPVSPLANAVTLTASGFHTCATTTLGGTVCWGRSQQWELAQLLDSALPVVIAGAPLDTGSIATSSSLCHSCTLLQDGSLRCWGSATSFANDCRNELGDNAPGGSLVPVTPLLPGP